MKKRNLFLRYFGLLVLILGIIFNILMIVYEAWPTAIFFIFCLVGIIQICASFINKKIKFIWQLFWSFIPFIIFYIYIQVNAASKDIFLIPEGYRGKVYIQYGDKNGKEKESEGFWRVYRIPKDGKLKTKYELKGESINLSDAKYFYVDKNGNRKLISTYCENCTVKDTVSIQVIWGDLGTNENGNYQTFYVGIPNKSFSRE